MKVKHFLTILTGLAVCLVMLGAYTRLTHSGLGCPDWPGCYGKLVVVSKTDLSSAQALYPDRPVDKLKALTEMTHRYVAGFILLSIVGLLIVALRQRWLKKQYPLLLPLLLVFIVCFQALLGMWTVTLKLLPQVVMGHLLGGMSLVCALWWHRLSVSEGTVYKANTRFKWWVLLGLFLIVLQVCLGGWVSSNYAGVSCIGFPFCQGDWFNQLNFKEAFNVAIQQGADYQGGVLSYSARLTLQLVHRLMALVVVLYWLGLGAILLWRGEKNIKPMTLALLLIISLQVCLGVLNVLYMLPMSVAVLHNGVALLLLLAAVSLFYFTRVGKFSNVI